MIMNASSTAGMNSDQARVFHALPPVSVPMIAALPQMISAKISRSFREGALTG
jgi:hypothetical protein